MSSSKDRPSCADRRSTYEHWGNLINVAGVHSHVGDVVAVINPRRRNAITRSRCTRCERQRVHCRVCRGSNCSLTRCPSQNVENRGTGRARNALHKRDLLSIQRKNWRGYDFAIGKSTDVVGKENIGSRACANSSSGGIHIKVVEANKVGLGGTTRNPEPEHDKVLGAIGRSCWIERELRREHIRAKSAS